MYLAFLTVFLYIDLLCAETVEVHSSFPLEMSWKVFKICLFFFCCFSHLEPMSDVDIAPFFINVHARY